jgi:predicted RNA binding protein YcfA (HicA-like mRNA interferase family)
MHKEIKNLIKDFEAAGFDVVLTKGNTHPKVLSNGHLVTTLPSSPSDHRSIKNAQATLRRLARNAALQED